MMDTTLSPHRTEYVSTEDDELLECLRRIGKGLIASGVSVGVVENTLTEIALVYDRECEVMALPNLIMIELGHARRSRLDFAVQRLTTLQLDKVSEFVELVDQVKQKQLPLETASREIDRIMAKKPRFHAATVVLGYSIACVGLTLLYRPELKSVMITGGAGLLVGLMLQWSKRQPRYNLLLPVFAAFVVSTLVFGLTLLGFIYGSANLLITPLISFLPGAMLTTGMIELASMHILSGSARLIYGAAVLSLLFVGIGAGLALTGLPNHLVYAYEAVVFPWWAPLLGTLLFGVGTFMRLSGANRDLFWMLVVLYIAMLAQYLGEQIHSSYVGGFLGATCMALSSELIARSPRRTSAVVSQALAFWFLVPGARGLLSVTSLLGKDVQTAALGLAEMVMLIISITLGVLLGTLLVSPQKFVPVTIEAGQLRTTER